MEQAKSLDELLGKIVECPHCREVDPPMRSIAAYRSGIGQVFIISCAKCHRPILCGAVEEKNDGQRKVV